MSELLTGLGSRPARIRYVQKFFIVVAKHFFPRDFTSRLAWDSYQLVDAAIALTSWEKQLMVEMFGADPPKVHIVPNGVEQIFFQNPHTKTLNQKLTWLVCTATITQRKRVLELAEAACIAKTPVWIIGNPYTESDAYFLRFLDVVKSSSGLIRYEGGISDRSRMADIYQSARGFVLLSTMESLSLSALEAVASGCPLLLSDLPWARCTFGERASYAHEKSASQTASILRDFYDSAPTLPVPPKTATWNEIASLISKIYRALLTPV
jgi:glycosyltransferase involved in cell wall biosynthesis